MSNEQDTKYNGWTNYETWAAKLWMDNDEGSYLHWREQSKEVWENAEAGTETWQTKESNARMTLADLVKEWHEERAEELGLLNGDKLGVFADFVTASLSECNWHEIASNMLDETKDEA